MACWALGALWGRLRRAGAWAWAWPWVRVRVLWSGPGPGSESGSWVGSGSWAWAWAWAWAWGRGLGLGLGLGPGPGADASARGCSRGLPAPCRGGGAGSVAEGGRGQRGGPTTGGPAACPWTRAPRRGQPRQSAASRAMAAPGQNLAVVVHRAGDLRLVRAGGERGGSGPRLGSARPVRRGVGSGAALGGLAGWRRGRPRSAARAGLRGAGPGRPGAPVGGQLPAGPPAPGARWGRPVHWCRVSELNWPRAGRGEGQRLPPMLVGLTCGASGARGAQSVGLPHG